MSERDGDEVPEEFREQPSRYVWRWTTWSWVCVAIGAMVVLMWWTLKASMGVGILLGLVIAVGGGIAFGFVPRASLAQKTTPMTPRARRKASEEKP